MMMLGMVFTPMRMAVRMAVFIVMGGMLVGMSIWKSDANGHLLCYRRLLAIGRLDILKNKITVVQIKYRSSAYLSYYCLPDHRIV